MFLSIFKSVKHVRIFCYNFRTCLSCSNSLLEHFARPGYCVGWLIDNLAVPMCPLHRWHLHLLCKAWRDCAVLEKHVLSRCYFDERRRPRPECVICQ